MSHCGSFKKLQIGWQMTEQLVITTNGIVEVGNNYSGKEHGVNQIQTYPFCRTHTNTNPE